MRKLLCILLLACPLFGQTTHTTASQEGNNTFTGTNTFGQIPVFSLGLGAVTASSVSVSGTSTLSRIQKDCRVDGVTYTTIGAAYADSTNCKSVRVPSGYTETLAANLVLSRSAVPIIFEGTAAIAMGAFQITSAGTVNSVAIVAPFCFISNGAASCVDFTYTGTAQAIVIGDSSTHSKDLLIRGINVTTSGNGSSCLKINNLDEFEVSAFKCSNTAGTSPIGIITNGTGTFVGVGKFDNVQIVMRGTNSTGYQFQTLTTHTQIIGGSIDLDTGAGAVCFDVQGPNTQSIELVMPNANTCNLAVKVESTATSVGTIVGDLRTDSGVVTVANFATGTQANFIRCINCATNALFTDSGSNNTFETPIEQQVNSKLFRQQSSSGGFAIFDLADNSAMIAKGITGATQINSSTGNPVRINTSQSGATGTEFWGSGAAVLIVDQNGTLHPAVAGAVGIGTAALPTKNLFIGNAATNNTTWAPVVTAARTLTSPDGNSSTVIPFSFTTTAATTDNVTVTGMTSSGHCTLTPTNTAAAAGIASVFISTKAANQITVTHTATAAWTFDGMCTSN